MENVGRGCITDVREKVNLGKISKFSSRKSICLKHIVLYETCSLNDLLRSYIFELLTFGYSLQPLYLNYQWLHETFISSHFYRPMIFCNRT